MNRRFVSVVLVVLSLLVAMGRFLIPGHDLSWPGTYEAFAHIWIGVLLAMGFSETENAPRAWIYLALLTVLELVMFKAQGHHSG